MTAIVGGSPLHAPPLSFPTPGLDRQDPLGDGREPTHHRPSSLSLAEAFPAIAAEWHPTRNTTNPDQIGCGTTVKVWWLCQACGHEWRTAVDKRTRRGQGCSPCANRRNGERLRIPQPGRSLADLHPHIIGEWHPTLNKDVTAHDVRPTTRDLYWWRDAAGHEWEEAPLNRTRRRTPGCNDCGLWGTSVEEIRLRHELLAAGVPASNSPVEVGKFKNGRPLSCDIVCEKWRLAIDFDGYRFHRPSTNIARDTRKTRELVAQGWTVIRVRENLPPLGDNDVVVGLSSTEVERAKAVLSKIVDLGYPVERYAEYITTEAPWAAQDASWASQALMPVDRALTATHPELLAEWHPTKNIDLSPERLRPTSQTRVWWRCPKCEREWSTILASRASSSPANLCRCIADMNGTLAELFPHLAAEWHPTRNGSVEPSDVDCRSKFAAWWLCRRCDREWATRVSSRTANGGSGCRGCIRRSQCTPGQPTKPRPGRSLADLFPEIAAEWDVEENGDLDPSTVGPSSHHAVWWRCSRCGRGWRTTPYHRTSRGHGCRTCSNNSRTRVPRVGNSLAERFPEIASEWHPTKNVGVTPADVTRASKKKVWWLCPRCGYEWQISPYHRTTCGHGCRRCNGYRPPRKSEDPQRSATNETA